LFPVRLVHGFSNYRECPPVKSLCRRGCGGEFPQLCRGRRQASVRPAALGPLIPQLAGIDVTPPHDGCCSICAPDPALVRPARTDYSKCKTHFNMVDGLPSSDLVGILQNPCYVPAGTRHWVSRNWNMMIIMMMENHPIDKDRSRLGLHQVPLEFVARPLLPRSHVLAFRRTLFIPPRLPPLVLVDLAPRYIGLWHGSASDGRGDWVHSRRGKRTSHPHHIVLLVR
jgi:hypothetical protein